MKIVVTGGSGLIGRNVVSRLVAQGHDPVPASPSTGVDTITGEGLADVTVGADVVIDVSNAPVWDDDAVMEFFTTSSRNLLAAERDARVGHHIAVSIVGADRLPDSGYLRAKVAQEAEIEAGAIPYTILRAGRRTECALPCKRLPLCRGRHAVMRSGDEGGRSQNKFSKWGDMKRPLRLARLSGRCPASSAAASTSRPIAIAEPATPAPSAASVHADPLRSIPIAESSDGAPGPVSVSANAATANSTSCSPVAGLMASFQTAVRSAVIMSADRPAAASGVARPRTVRMPQPVSVEPAAMALCRPDRSPSDSKNCPVPSGP
jgi:NAD(P)H-binding